MYQQLDERTAHRIAMQPRESFEHRPRHCKNSHQPFVSTTHESLVNGTGRTRGKKEDAALERRLVGSMSFGIWVYWRLTGVSFHDR